MSKDYYKILGTEKTASHDDIKKAFRKLAHKYHPDKQGGDEAKFKEVNEAYQVLGNEEKRKRYDQFGADFEHQGGFGGGASWEDFMRAARGQGGFGGAQQFDFGDIDLGDLFGGMFNFGGGRGAGSRRSRRGNDIQVDVEVEFREAVFGIDKDIRLTKLNACDVCNGTGGAPGSSMKTCDVCQGQGQVVRIQQTILGAMQTASTCHKCHGRGQVTEKPCQRCQGEGRVKNESQYKVKIPAGIDNGGTIRLSGKGESGGVGGESGDLYIVVHVKSDPRFVREGNDIHTDIHVSYPQAALGDTVEIDTLDGKKKIVVPDGTQSGQQIRLKGLGVPYINSNGPSFANAMTGKRGAHYVRVIVDVPRKVSRSAKKLLEELKGELG